MIDRRDFLRLFGMTAATIATAAHVSEAAVLKATDRWTAAWTRPGNGLLLLEHVRAFGNASVDDARWTVVRVARNDGPTLLELPVNTYGGMAVWASNDCPLVFAGGQRPVIECDAAVAAVTVCRELDSPRVHILTHTLGAGQWLSVAT